MYSFLSLIVDSDLESALFHKAAFLFTALSHLLCALFYKNKALQGVEYIIKEYCEYSGSKSLKFNNNLGIMQRFIKT